MVKWDRFSGESIASLVTGRIGNRDISIFDNATAALHSLRENPVQVGIFGLTLPDMDGADLLDLAVQERLVQRIIVVTWRTDERARQLLKRIGPYALVETRYQGPDKLEEALVWALDYDPSVSNFNKQGKVVRANAPLLHQILSEREMQVFALLADGSDDQTAAEALGLSKTTIHTHRQRIMSKLGVNTRAALIRDALRRGVIRFTENGTLRPGLHSKFGLGDT